MNFWFLLVGVLAAASVATALLVPRYREQRRKKAANEAAETARAERWARHRRLAFQLGYAMQGKDQQFYQTALNNFLEFLRERNPKADEALARSYAQSERAALAVGR